MKISPQLFRRTKNRSVAGSTISTVRPVYAPVLVLVFYAPCTATPTPLPTSSPLTCAQMHWSPLRGTLVAITIHANWIDCHSSIQSIITNRVRRNRSRGVDLCIDARNTGWIGRIVKRYGIIRCNCVKIIGSMRSVCCFCIICRRWLGMVWRFVLVNRLGEFLSDEKIPPLPKKKINNAYLLG